MKTPTEWMLYFGHSVTAGMPELNIPGRDVTVVDAEDIKAIQLDARKHGLHDAFRIANDMTDLRNEDYPGATLKSIEYFIGIRRGVVIASNAILKVLDEGSNEIP